MPATGDTDVLLVYFGTYTRGASEGIYVARFDRASGTLEEARLAAKTVNPSFLAIHPTGRYLYAVGEIADFEGKKSGGVHALAIEQPAGTLRHLNAQSSEGTGPCHLIVDATGRDVLVANYGSGSAACLPIAEDGRLKPASAVVQHEGSSINPRRQEGPHAHSINLDLNNRIAVVADLGLDKIMIYRFDAARGSLMPNDPPSVSVVPGGGPRHFAFHPNGRFAYTNNEMASSVTAFTYDGQRGALEPIQTISTLPEEFDGDNTTAEIRVHPNGRYLYVSNRGHNSIAMFAIDPSTGKLSPLGHEPSGGKIPRNFNLDPSGRYLLAANQDSDNVVVFRVKQDSGRLERTGSHIEVPTPVCIRFLKTPDTGP